MSNALTKPERSEPLRQEQWTGRPHPHHARPGPPEKDTGSRARRRPVSNPGPPTSDSHGANPGLPAAAGSGDQQGWEQEQGRNSCFLAALPEDEPSGSLDVTTRQPRTPRPWSRPPAAGHSKPSPGRPRRESKDFSQGPGGSHHLHPSGNQPGPPAAPPPRPHPPPHPQPWDPSSFRPFHLPFHGATRSPSSV